MTDVIVDAAMMTAAMMIEAMMSADMEAATTIVDLFRDCLPYQLIFGGERLDILLQAFVLFG